MNGIIGMTELALMTELNDEQQECLKSVKKSANSLLRIINDVLDYTKIEVGKISIENKPFSLTEVIKEIITLFNINAKQKGIYINKSIDNNIPTIIYGDSVRLKQVLINLIGNAIKFTIYGGIDIIIELKDKTDDKIELLFMIKDTGIGIPDEKRNQLFDRFTQLDSSYTKQYQGTGLGLAISKKLVEMMYGQIWHEHQENNGSTFCFTCVFETTISNVDTEKLKDNTKIIENQIDNGTKTILIAEDDDVSRKLIVTFLQKKGFRTLVSKNGEEAIEILRKTNVDMVLMDIQMPICDGFCATKQIRILENEKNKHTSIIAMTAYALDGDKEKCLEMDMDDYISKPIDFRIVYDMILNYLM